MIQTFTQNDRWRSGTTGAWKDYAIIVPCVERISSNFLPHGDANATFGGPEAT
jgi:hypothetical protein